MSHVLVLVSGDKNKPLSDIYLSQAQEILDVPVLFRWLAPQKAAECDIDFSVMSPLLKTLQNHFESQHIDVFLIPQENRRKKLLLADMDATIVAGETLDELASHVGLKDKIADITTRAMQGELDFKEALIERVRLLKNVPLSVLDLTLSQMSINEGARETIQVMRRHGAMCYLVSGGFTYFTGPISKHCGFNGHHGNQLNLSNGKLTGDVTPPILDKNTKLFLLKEYAKNLDLDIEDTMAVGDGANDIPMLQNAGLGIGYRPKALVRECIHNCIIHTDLTSLLYIQGYSWRDLAMENNSI